MQTLSAQTAPSPSPSSAAEHRVAPVLQAIPPQHLGEVFPLIASLMDHGFTAIETLNRKNDKPPVIRREVCQPELPYCQRLSAREVQVLVLIGQGYDNNEIMWKLGIAQTTLSTHIKNLLNKTGMRARCQLVLFAVRKHLVGVL